MSFEVKTKITPYMLFAGANALEVCDLPSNEFVAKQIYDAMEDARREEIGLRSSWGKLKENQLRELWSEGHTASSIADIMGLISRNSVLGKVRRLKLVRRK